MREIDPADVVVSLVDAYDYYCEEVDVPISFRVFRKVFFTGMNAQLALLEEAADA